MCGVASCAAKFDPEHHQGKADSPSSRQGVKHSKGVEDRKRGGGVGCMVVWVWVWVVGVHTQCVCGDICHEYAMAPASYAVLHSDTHGVQIRRNSGQVGGVYLLCWGNCCRDLLGVL